MGARAQRREESEQRRKAWRLRWVELARLNNQDGVPLRKCVELVARDADALIRETPQLRSEIIRAMDEFVERLSAAVAMHSNPDCQK